MNAQVIKGLLEDLSNKGVSRIIISGGEPLLRNDLMEMIPECNSEIILFTNGTLINEDNAQKIAEKFDRVFISLEGPDEETNSKLRGKGNFEKVMESLRLLKKSNMESSLIRTTLTTLNMKKMEKMLDLSYSMGCSINFGRFIPHDESKKYLQISEEEYSQVFQKIFHTYSDLYKKYSGKNKKLLPAYFDSTSTKNGNRMVFHEIPIANCGAGETQLSISPSGDVYPCPHLHREEFLLGNVMKKPLNDIIEDGLNFSDKINVQNFSICSGCYLRNICGGGCRAVALNNTNSLSGQDIYCQVYKLELEGTLWGNKSDLWNYESDVYVEKDIEQS